MASAPSQADAGSIAGMQQIAGIQHTEGARHDNNAKRRASKRPTPPRAGRTDRRPAMGRMPRSAVSCDSGGHRPLPTQINGRTGMDGTDPLSGKAHPGPDRRHRLATSRHPDSCHPDLYGRRHYCAAHSSGWQLLTGPLLVLSVGTRRAQQRVHQVVHRHVRPFGAVDAARQPGGDFL
jgi:hypothetical protein